MTDDLHKKKFKKNMAVLALILFFVALIWCITMVKISNASKAHQAIKVQQENAQQEERINAPDSIQKGSEQNNVPDGNQ